MKRFFTSTAVGILFITGSHIPYFGHDLPGVVFKWLCANGYVW